MAHHFVTRLISVGILCLALGGCEQASSPVTTTPAPAVSSEDMASISLETNKLVRQRLAAAQTTNGRLRLAAETFLAAPDEATREALQIAWREAHLAFASLRVMPHFSDDSELMFEVDAWPIEPGFLDSLPEYPESGIVNDPTLSIDLATLASQHGITDPGEVSLGYHPLEYYAFARPIEDFVVIDDDGGETVTRRRQVVALIADALTNRVASLEVVEEASTATPREQLMAVLVGLRIAAQDGFQQAALIVDSDHGHAEFSLTSRETLAAQVQTLQTLLTPDSHLYGLLETMAPATASAMQETLARADMALTGENPAEQELGRLPLMLSAIGHQLEEYITLLRHAPPAP